MSMSMSREFYEAMQYRIESGQFKMEDILVDLDTSWGKGLITAEQYNELKARAFETCDPNYEGNRVATPYDEGQDIQISGNTMATLENFELILGLMGMNEEVMILSAREVATISAIGYNYVRMIIAGKRTFDSVPTRVKQEVADKLIELGRDELITDPSYLPQLSTDTEVDVEQPTEEVQQEA